MSRFLYQKQSFLLIKRDESCITRPEFELIWVAVEVPHQHNIVCGLIYRHPGTKLDKTVAEKLNSEGKYYLLMGDFINKVLNCDSETEVFVNTLGSYAFHPQLLRPTRITNHPATLIDNIFFNYLEHHVVSRGNKEDYLTVCLTSCLSVRRDFPCIFYLPRISYLAFN